MTPDKKFSLRYQGIIIVAVLMLLFGEYLGLFNGVNMYFYDLSFRLRGEKQTSKDIVIAAIDEKSLAKLGRWPFRRLHYASLLDMLRDARYVGFNIIMAEPSDDDFLLADAMKKHGRVILPVYIDRRQSRTDPSIYFQTLKTGHIHVEHDIDGIVRKVFHTLYFRDFMLPSFSSVIYEESFGKAFHRQRSVSSIIDIIQADPTMINYYGTSYTYQHIPFSDIIEGKYPPSFFIGKIVLVGVTAAGLEEKLITPFTQKRDKIASVEVHAHILNNLLDRNEIIEIPFWLRWFLSLTFSLSFFLIFLRVNEKKSFLLCLFALSIAAAAIFVLFSFFCFWLSPAMLFLGVVFMLLISYFIKVDIAARRLDEEYSKVISHLGLSTREIIELTSMKGFLGFPSKGTINARLELLTRITDRIMELDRLKSMFIASMSHELRTPLNSIIGFSSVLKKEWAGPVNEEQQSLLLAINRSGKHLLLLINDVIDISKIESGELDTHFENFDLHDVISEIVELMNKEFVKKHLELKVESIHLTMHTDRRRLFQSILNLVSNAGKFTMEGSVRISAQTVSSLKMQEASKGIIIDKIRKSKDANKDLQPETCDPHLDRNFVEISVEDTGIGIKEEDLPKLFQSFVRLDSPLRAKVLGTGLGLYLTKKLVTEVLRGEVTVESEIGKGSRFMIRIPVRI